MDTQSAPPADRPRRILIVDDDDGRRELFAKVLGHEGYEIDSLADGTTLVSYVRACPPDLILLDVMLPEITGFELCGDLRMMDDMRLTPIILVTSACQDEESAVRGLLSGADDYVVTPTRLEELRARVRVQLRNRRDREIMQWANAQRAALKTEAMSDALTGLANRRAADQALDAALLGGEQVLAVLLDIDHFKPVNDTHGHAAGDSLISEVARAIQGTTRRGDLAARYGGDEFLVLVRGAPLEAADRIGQRYRAAIRHLRRGPAACAGEDGPVPVTVSIGVAGVEPGAGAPRERLLAAADAALYEAKLAGRDRVVVCPRPVIVGRDQARLQP